MRVSTPFELPPDRARAHRRAVKLEYITIAYLISAVAFIYLTLGASQAMKAAWYEDLLSLVPPIAFLVGSRVRLKRPNRLFPYGYHRAVSIAFLCASIALFVMGLFILYDSVMKLLAFEHTPIGLVQPFGEPVWLGWFMIPALLWSAIPAVILGRMKIPLARELHDKGLYADALMNKADWMTAGAALIGVIGIGLGWWWADPAAAIFIALDITHDGFGNLRRSISDLMDSRPELVDGSAADPIVERVQTELEAMSWISSARVRLREDGHVFFGEALIVPSVSGDLTARLDEATRSVLALDWRLYEIALVPVGSLERHDEDLGPQ